MQCDAFFSYIYSNVVETLADADRACQELTHRGHGALIQEWVQARDGKALAQAAAGMKHNIDKRWLPHMSWLEFYALIEVHCLETENESMPGKICFLNAFNGRWKHNIGFRTFGQHARCDECAMLANTRREHPDPQERARATKAYPAHLNRMIDDRRLDARLTHLSELSTSATCSFSGVLHVRIDGMDQSKFNCPRNLDNAKMWSKYWRPTLHTIGVIVEGLLDVYLVADQDVFKGSDTEITVLAYCLELAVKELPERGLMMPAHLSLNYDNTGKEGKNQVVLKFLAWLVATGRFRSTQDGQGQKGHTHNSLDQRFSVIATCLMRATTLETPHDLCARIAAHLEPCRGRKLVCDTLDSVWDWKELFHPFDMRLSGVAASASNPDVCHSKRFVLRRDLPSIVLPGWEIETPNLFVGLEPNPGDVIMCAKQWWSDQVLAQPPECDFAF